MKCFELDYRRHRSDLYVQLNIYISNMKWYRRRSQHTNFSSNLFQRFINLIVVDFAGHRLKRVMDPV